MGMMTRITARRGVTPLGNAHGNEPKKEFLQHAHSVNVGKFSKCFHFISVFIA
jgi:hypothetical protein